MGTVFCQTWTDLHPQVNSTPVAISTFTIKKNYLKNQILISIKMDFFLFNLWVRQGFKDVRCHNCGLLPQKPVPVRSHVLNIRYIPVKIIAQCHIHTHSHMFHDQRMICKIVVKLFVRSSCHSFHSILYYLNVFKVFKL